MPKNDLTTIKQNIDEIYNFWDNIPNKTSVRIEDYNKALLQDTRVKIVQLLVNGIESNEDQLGKEFDIPDRKRYALSANELMERLSEKLEGEEPISINNVFYHLNILIESGIVKLIGHLTSGNHRIKYYGRTSKFIVPVKMVEEWMVEYNERLYEPLKNYLIEKKGVDKTIAQNLMNKIIDHRTRLNNSFLDWIEINSDLLDKHKIFRPRLFGALHQFEITDPEYNAVLIELKKMLF